MEDWYYETWKNKVRYGVRVQKKLYSAQTEYQKMDVFESEHYGRVLVLDGYYMTSERDEYFYHEMISHPALCTVDSPKRVLIIGGGDGGTAREVLRHPEVESVVMVEIDGQVVETCKELLPAISGNIWNDPRFELRIGDGIAYVADAATPKFDVILLDGTDPVGPAEGLFGIDFYENVKSKLNPGGVFALQSESPFLMPDIFAQVQSYLGKVFAKVNPYFGPVPLYGAGIWSWTYATDSADHTKLNAERLEKIAHGCKQYSAGTHRGAFAVPGYVRALLES